MNEPGIQSLMDQETLARRVRAGETPACPITITRTHSKPAARLPQ